MSDRSRSGWRGSRAYAGKVAGIATAYVAAAQLGLALAYGESTASAVWPPAGIALAALVVFGVRLWPGVLLGALVAVAAQDFLKQADAAMYHAKAGGGGRYELFHAAMSSPRIGTLHLDTR